MAKFKTICECGKKFYWLDVCPSCKKECKFNPEGVTIESLTEELKNLGNVLMEDLPLDKLYYLKENLYFLKGMGPNPYVLSCHLNKALMDRKVPEKLAQLICENKEKCFEPDYYTCCFKWKVEWLDNIFELLHSTEDKYTSKLFDLTWKLLYA